ncbi:MAG: homoserine O-acetyltransferase [Bacteroidota bacterium]|nr:homoserine O-acetyltransferase [Bacteroidota bacterium]MDP4233092.1 homoserine O-acetyltransferase [Bacteroidota bacterium]MDP4241763.1 homoserine O-acetyltransferase [Bacteroidota bacterium]MDP4287421.1 homoserine O-acetyltransferase [Bacteroidota bacterium]
MLNHNKRRITLRNATFVLQSGVLLPDVEIAFDTYGELVTNRSNVVLVLHALTGWPSAHEWWGGLIGEGKLLDPAQHFILCPNLLGSCYGSTGPESINPKTGTGYLASFPEITPRDMAKAILSLLDELDIVDVQLAIGGSLGGMVILELASLASDRFCAIVPIAVSGSQSAWRIAFGSTVRKTITSFDPTLKDRDKLKKGLWLARQFAMTTYRSSIEFNERFGRELIGDKFQVETYLEHQGDKIVERFSPYSYLTLARAMELYELPHSLPDMQALFVGVSSDVVYDTNEIAAFAARFPRGEYQTLVALHGHDSFLIDTEALTEIVKPFVERVTLREERVA